MNRIRRSFAVLALILLAGICLLYSATPQALPIHGLRGANMRMPGLPGELASLNFFFQCGPCPPVGSPPYCGESDSPEWDTSTCSWTCVPNGNSPILIDTSGQGFQLTSAQNGVTFDISGSGNPIQLGWTAFGSDNAFLALPGADGLVHTGKELFGNFTTQPASTHPNGFAALGVYDQPAKGGNGDGIIDARDKIFSALRLWIDSNHDGICQPSELFTLPEKGVNSISLHYELSMKRDRYGNLFRYRSLVDPDGSPTNFDVGRTSYDVFLTAAK